jgi:cytochrome b pre-mRNA-processing protein 3
MLMKWWRQPSRDRTIETIYGAIVAQARNPAFYDQYGVPDTFEGRFDLLVMHLFLYLHRVSGPNFRAGVGQPVFDLFCADLDGNLREMGVGDLTVPKRMQKFGEAFYGRSEAYAKALAGNDRDAAAAALARNVYGREQPTADVVMLSDYFFEAAQMLRETGEAHLQNGQFSFPVPRYSKQGGRSDGGERHAEHH